MDKDSEITKNNELLLRIDKSIYEKVAILKTCYLFQDKFHTNIKQLSDSTYGIFLKRKNDKLEFGDLAKEFFNELIDQQIRLENERMFGDLRREIVKQAFKPIHYNEIKSKFEDKSS